MLQKISYSHTEVKQLDKHSSHSHSFKRFAITFKAHRYAQKFLFISFHSKCEHYNFKHTSPPLTLSKEYITGEEEEEEWVTK